MHKYKILILILVTNLSFSSSSAISLAAAGTLNNSRDYQHTISIASAYINKDIAGAISYSTNYNKFGVKLNLALDNGLQFGLGIGASYSIRNDDLTLKNAKAYDLLEEQTKKVDLQSKEISKLKEKLKEILEEKKNEKNNNVF